MHPITSLCVYLITSVVLLLIFRTLGFHGFFVGVFAGIMGLIATLLIVNFFESN